MAGEDEVVEAVEGEGQDSADLVTTVPASAITSTTNPKAEGWWEDDPDDMSGYYKCPTNDTSPVSGKTYYSDVAYQIASPEYRYLFGGSSMAKAISTYQTYLVYSTASAGTYAKLIDIKDYPDMIPAPNMLDATTMSDGAEYKIPGIKRIGDGYQFTANYTPENYQAIKALEGHNYRYGLFFGGTTAGVPDGHNGKITWEGDIRAALPGKGVDEVADMQVIAIPTTDPEWAAGT